MIKNSSIYKRIALVAIMSALSGVLYIFPKFSLPIFPSFLEINFSMLPVLIVCFMLGPIDGVSVALIRILVKIIFVGSGTAYVGELADAMLGVSVALTVAFSYKYIKIKHKDIISLLIGIATWILVGILTNYFINIPFYVNAFFGGDIETLANVVKPVIPSITADNFMGKYILFAVIPFNLLIAFVVSFITFLVHSRLKFLYDKIGVSKEKKEDEVE